MSEKPTEPTVVIDGYDNGHPFNNPDAVALLDAYSESSTVFDNIMQINRTPPHAMRVSRWSLVDAIRFLRGESRCSLLEARDFVYAYVAFSAMRQYPPSVVAFYNQEPRQTQDIYSKYILP